MNIINGKFEEKYMIFNLTIGIEKLIQDYPARLFDERKKILYDIALSKSVSKDKEASSSEIQCSRWRSMELPLFFPPKEAPTEYLIREDVFQYDSEFGREPNQIEWHLNFADLDLFMGYGGSLMAQDELQVAEHPALASLREMLLAESEASPEREPCTRDESDNPTPYIITGIERRLSISVDANPDKGRPDGIYGKRFADASEDTIRRAVKLIFPPTITNLIAMEAPSRGKGNYNLAQIKDIFTTAYTAFVAARYVSTVIARKKSRPVVTIHTGNWGTGAYGGNKTLMVLIQLAAAKAAGINRFVYHSILTQSYREALDILIHKIIPNNKRITLPSLFEQIHALGFKWGIPDGN